MIDTTPMWNATNAVSPFGEQNTATYGQTITAPAGAPILTSFSFFLDDYMNPDTADFQAYVFAWDGQKATGPALFQSSPISTTNNNGNDGFEEIAISTGTIALTAGQEYVLAFNASNQFDSEIGTARWGTINNHASGPDTYAGGTFVFLNNGSDFSQLNSTPWSERDGDLAFKATFVPEPSSIMLLCLGGLGVVFRRKRPTNYR